MSVKSGQAVTVLFTTQTPSTGAATDADSLPTGLLYVNGTVNGAAVTITNIATGVYKAAVALPSLTAGDMVGLRISATVALVPGEDCVWQDVSDTKIVSDLQDLTAAQVNAQCDTALSDYDPPTKAELDSGLAGLNDLTAAEVQAECEDALEAYDLDHFIQVTAGAEEPTDGSYLDQIMHKDAGQTFDATTDSLEALQENQEGVDADVWTYSTRTLTTAAGTVDSAVSGSTITLRRGDTLSASITGLGDISSRTKLWFTVKVKKTDADSASIAQIEETANMLYFNGAAAAVATNGTLTVDDETGGDITIAIDETETDDLARVRGLHYDVQMLDTGGDVTTLAEGRLDIVLDVTRAIA